MALLKRIRSATLVEVLVATVLIVIIFMAASLVLNNLLQNTFSKNTHSIDTRINELEYQIQNHQLILPYTAVHGDWEINISEENKGPQRILVFKALNLKTEKEIVKTQINGS